MQGRPAFALAKLTERSEAGPAPHDDFMMDQSVDRYADADIDRAVWAPRKTAASVIVADMKKWPNCRARDVCGSARPFDGTARASKRR
jgi:hypothetical protein